jgi:beta-galactosidase GanA
MTEMYCATPFRQTKDIGARVVAIWKLTFPKKGDALSSPNLNKNEETYVASRLFLNISCRKTKKRYKESSKSENYQIDNNQELL